MDIIYLYNNPTLPRENSGAVNIQLEAAEIPHLNSLSQARSIHKPQRNQSSTTDPPTIVMNHRLSVLILLTISICHTPRIHRRDIFHPNIGPPTS